MSWQKKPEVVVITGAGAGVGRATVREFAKAGALIGLIARDRARLEQVADEVQSLAGEAVVCVADVADAAQVEAAAATIENKFGRIDVWVNDAMATIYSPFSEISPEDYKRATEVTYLGAVYGTMAALKRMKQRDSGVIVQVGSALAYRAIPLQAPYCGAKFAIRGFTDALRSELLHDRSRVRITMVQMPALNTPQFDWAKNQMPMRAHRLFRTAKQPAGRSFAAGQFVPTGRRDFAAHGRFDDRARPGGMQLWVTLYRGPIALGLVAAGVLACCGLLSHGARR